MSELLAFLIRFCQSNSIDLHSKQLTKGQKMTLEEYKAHIEAQRNASKAQALSVLSATIKERKKGDN
jgi:hypothetical protein